MGKSTLKNARSVMIQGTSSHVGKSVLTAAVLRILKNRGFRVAPFKAQNMALNSFVTKDGDEIGRAQAFQAEAAGIEPVADLNPVLLKPSGESVSQVIIQGRVYGVMNALEYHAFKKEARRFVEESYRRLAAGYDIIVIEGAGSPAEINLRDNDIANMGVAEMTGSPAIIVGDIDRGGVFASLVGTMELLTGEERGYVKGFIINKFRGDINLLKPGIEYLTKRTGVPTLGVIPMLDNTLLPDEDSVALEGGSVKSAGIADKVQIKVIKLPRISNFTDFDPFKCDQTVDVSFIECAAGIDGADIVIIPGSKNTISDLGWLKQRGFEGALKGFYGSGGTVAGICGGFQMLGVRISDPFGVESKRRETVKGLELLEAQTILKRDKKTFQVVARAKNPADSSATPILVRGYEIHMGETSGPMPPFSMITKRNGAAVRVPDGGISGASGTVWGTYIHGIFDNDRFRKALIESLRKRRTSVSRSKVKEIRKGARTAPGAADKAAGKGTYLEMKESALRKLSKTVEENLNIKELLRIIGV